LVDCPASRPLLRSSAAPPITVPAWGRLHGRIVATAAPLPGFSTAAEAIEAARAANARAHALHDFAALRGQQVVAVSHGAAELVIHTPAGGVRVVVDPTGAIAGIVDPVGWQHPPVLAEAGPVEIELDGVTFEWIGRGSPRSCSTKKS
jgi:hypothetical protein